MLTIVNKDHLMKSMSQKKRLVIMMGENGKVYAEIARRVGVSRERISVIMQEYYATPRGKRMAQYRLKRYFCEVCGQPKRITMQIDDILVELCDECARTLSMGEKRYYQNRFDWSLNYPECVGCQSTKYHHVGHGRCAKCYPEYRKLIRIGFYSSHAA